MMFMYRVNDRQALVGLRYVPLEAVLFIPESWIAYKLAKYFANLRTCGH
jgi:hypothetical protein